MEDAIDLDLALAGLRSSDLRLRGGFFYSHLRILLSIGHGLR